MIDMNQYPHDSNLTINCLLRGLVLQASEGRLTPKLYVQLDNCIRENKNKYFISTMALLVKHQLVKEVTMSFLMVGHTHEGMHLSMGTTWKKIDFDEYNTQSPYGLLKKFLHLDIDARFAKISSALKKRDAKSLPSLKGVVESSLQQGMEAMTVTTVFNIRDWILPYLQDIHNHRFPHKYRSDIQVISYTSYCKATSQIHTYRMNY